MRDVMRIAIVFLLCATIVSRPTMPAGVGIAMIGAALAGSAAVRLRATGEARAFQNGGEEGTEMRLSRRLHDLALALSLLALLYALRPF